MTGFFYFNKQNNNFSIKFDVSNIIAKNKWGIYSIPEEISYTYTAQSILNGGVHEDTTIEFIRSVGGNIIHAGSGFGDFLPALKDCERVWTFEPNPLMYQCSLETIKHNNLSNIEILPFAIGKIETDVMIQTKDEFGLEMGPRSEISDTGLKVKQVTLDSIIPNNKKISLIHLDLEGFEFQALEGAKEIIKRDKPIIVLEIDSRAVTYNNYMLSIGYIPNKQLIFNSNEKMVFVNTVYIPKDNKPVDKEYWSSEIPIPLSPSDEDVEIYKQNKIPGSCLMLGCTKKLIEISDFQMDMDPWYTNKTVIKDDWLNNNTFYDTIIGDGVLSFTKELSDGILEMVQKNCKVFIARTFTKRLPIMKIANHFPGEFDFKNKPTKVINFENYSFYIWHF